MKALVSYAPYNNRLMEVPIPTIGDRELLLRVKGCGICAGDVKSYHGGIRIWGTSEENRYIEAPVIGGHEFFGEVVEVGGGYTEFKIGDRVVAEQIAPCGKCKFAEKENIGCVQNPQYTVLNNIYKADLQSI